MKGGFNGRYLFYNAFDSNDFPANGVCCYMTTSGSDMMSYTEYEANALRRVNG